MDALICVGIDKYTVSVGIFSFTYFQKLRGHIGDLLNMETLKIKGSPPVIM